MVSYRVCQILVLCLAVTLTTCQLYSIYIDETPGQRCSAGCVSPGKCPLGYFHQSSFEPNLFEYCCYVDDDAQRKQFDTKVANLKQMLDCRNRVMANLALTYASPDTESIDFTFNKFKNQLPAVRDNFLKYFTQLKVLIISSSAVNELPPDFIATNNLLESLNMNWNDITEIPENFFEHNSNLKNIDFSGNQITSLPPKLFKSTPKLEDVNLHFNNIQYLSSSTFKYLPNLRYLDVSMNKNFQCISSQVFRLNPQVSYVRFNDIGGRIFRGLQRTFCKEISELGCEVNMYTINWKLLQNERSHWPPRSCAEPGSVQRPGDARRRT